MALACKEFKYGSCIGRHSVVVKSTATNSSSSKIINASQTTIKIQKFNRKIKFKDYIHDHLTYCTVYFLSL